MSGRAPGSIRPYRAMAIATGAGVLGWQGLNLATGRFWHEYLIADAVASFALIGFALARPTSVATPGMLAGFAGMAGVLLAATTGKLLDNQAHPGTLAATAGLVPCLVGAIGLGIRLARGPAS